LGDGFRVGASVGLGVGAATRVRVGEGTGSGVRVTTGVRVAEGTGSGVRVGDSGVAIGVEVDCRVAVGETIGVDDVGNR